MLPHEMFDPVIKVRLCLRYLKLSTLCNPSLGECVGEDGSSRGNLPTGKDWSIL